MNHLIPLRLTTLASILLPSCQLYSVAPNTAHYVDAAFSGGEAKYADYTLHEWSLTSSEVIELKNKQGQTLYLLPISMSVKVKLQPLITCYRLEFETTKNVWDTGNFEFSQPFEHKKLYVALLLKDHSHAACRLSKYGIHRAGLEFTASKNLQSHLQSDAKVPTGWQMRRIAIPNLEQMIRKEIDLSGASYMTKRSILAQTAASSAYICIDLPLGIASSVLASFYESTFGHIL